MTTGSHLSQARRRLKRSGASQLTDIEVLALLIGGGSKSRDALDLAEALLRAHGGLHRLGANTGAIRARGLGAARIARIEAALEFGRRSIEGPVDRRRAFQKPGDAARCFRARLANLGHEVFSCLFLDSQHRVLRCDDLFYGTLDGAAVYPREVAVRALQYSAAAVIFAHNHPSGVAEPSSADRRITERLCAALALLDIRVLDHIIVGSGGEYSFAEAGLL